MTEPCGRLAKTHVTSVQYSCVKIQKIAGYIPPLPVIEQQKLCRQYHDHINNNDVANKSASVRGPPHKHRGQTPSPAQGPVAQGRTSHPTGLRSKRLKLGHQKNRSHQVDFPSHQVDFPSHGFKKTGRSNG